MVKDSKLPFELPPQNKNPPKVRQICPGCTRTRIEITALSGSADFAGTFLCKLCGSYLINEVQYANAIADGKVKINMSKFMSDWTKRPGFKNDVRK